MRRTKTAFISLYTEMGGGEYGLYHLLEHLDRAEASEHSLAPMNPCWGR